jgi:hypothetical protein
MMKTEIIREMLDTNSVFIWLIVREDFVQTVVAKVSNHTQLRTINLPTSKNLVIKSLMFPLRNIHNYTSTSSDERFVHILIDRKWHSSIFDVRSFRGCDCDTDHQLVLHIRERLSVRKRARQKSDIGLFHFKKLNDVKGKEQDRIKFSNWSARADVDINRA